MWKIKIIVKKVLTEEGNSRNIWKICFFFDCAIYIEKCSNLTERKMSVIYMHSWKQCPLPFHNGFVEAHALYHMTYDYTLLVRMKQRVLNTLSKEHNINGHRWSTTFDIYINSLTYFVIIVIIVIITLFFSFLRYNCSFHYCFIHFIIINAFLNIYHCFVIMFIILRSLIYYLISWFLTYF